ncbi:MAG: peptidoglycan bridge formation glycyltransferase FemA/FemB family protein [SAR324 cluster bacterium]|nr:peptidoglycan bridge formation glycyltransferase FemA/FemB family protein [SAR324 cluster bacterium]
MVFINSKKFFFTIVQTYYKDIGKVLEEPINGDILIAYQSPTSQSAALSKKFRTLHIDLSQTKDEILSHFVKNTRYEIRRAQNKDELELTITTEPGAQFIADFVIFYNQFSAQKGLPPCESEFLEALNSRRLLSLSVIKNKTGDALVFHAHIVCNGRARLFKSASYFRGVDTKAKALIGRANRYLQAEEIFYFKEIGLSLYDFGGISLDEQSDDLGGIDKFKMSFGGHPVEEYHCFHPISFFGKLAFLFLKRKWK